MLCYVLNWESISYVCMIIFCIGAWILVVGATLNNLWTHIICWVIWQVMVCLNCTTMMGYCNYLNINVKTSLNIFINFFHLCVKIFKHSNHFGFKCSILLYYMGFDEKYVLFYRYFKSMGLIYIQYDNFKMINFKYINK